MSVCLSLSLSLSIYLSVLLVHLNLNRSLSLSPSLFAIQSNRSGPLSFHCFTGLNDFTAASAGGGMMTFLSDFDAFARLLARGNSDATLAPIRQEDVGTGSKLPSIHICISMCLSVYLFI